MWRQRSGKSVPKPKEKNNPAMKKTVIISIIAFTLASCGTMNYFPTSDFAKINGINDLQGYYSNQSDAEKNSGIVSFISNNPYKYHRGSLLWLFNIQDTTDAVYITPTENRNEIKLIYHSETAEQEQVFNGKMKRKFFEIYHRKEQFFIPLIISNVDNNRIRIGKSKDGKLLIRDYVEKSGSILLIGTGYAWEHAYKFGEKTME
jgi:hypothetical protein